MMGSIAAAILDEAIALGARKIIFIGGVGVLQPEIARGDIIIPTRAIRDEGVSYHYLKPSQYAYPDKKVIATIATTLKKTQTPYHQGTVWTTSAPFRETITKVRKFHRQGVLAVDMEAASFFAVARHRKAQIGTIFSAGDYVGESEWDLRVDKNNIGKIKIGREELLQLAIKVFENL
jgi:uridine phosphorylase